MPVHVDPQSLANWLTVPQAAKLRRVSKSCIAKHIRLGDLVTAKIGRDWLIEPNSLRGCVYITGRTGRPRSKKR